MELEHLIEKIGQQPLFESALLMAGDVNPVNLQKQLSRWTSTGKVLQLRRGLYALAEPYRQKEPHPFLIGNTLVEPSYVSLESALAYYDMIPERVTEVTNITSRRRSKVYLTPFGRFKYQHVQSKLFFGFSLVQVTTDQYCYLARPEKALLDLIYLTPQGNELSYLETLRLQNLEKFDLSWMRATTKSLGMIKLIVAVENVAHVISQINYQQL